MAVELCSIPGSDPHFGPYRLLPWARPIPRSGNNDPFVVVLRVLRNEPEASQHKAGVLRSGAQVLWCGFHLHYLWCGLGQAPPLPHVLVSSYEMGQTVVLTSRR